MDAKEVAAFTDRLREESRAKHIPCMRRETAGLLADVVRKYQPKTVLEIGTSVGSSGLNVLNNCAAKLTTIEIDGDTAEVAKRNFSLCGFSDRAQIIVGDCFEVVYMMTDNRYDMVILDGPKSHYSVLYGWVKNMLNKGGVIFADDVNYYGLVDKEGVAEKKHRTNVEGMRRFRETVSGDKEVEAVYYDVEDGVLIITKR